MTRDRRKLYRVEVVCLVRGKEKIMTREYRATAISQVQQMALMLSGAVRIAKIEEVNES